MLKKKSNTPTEGKDTLIGTAGDDKIDGLGGNDTISGGGGDDVLTGGLGEDDLRGGAGDDIVAWRWGDGADRIDGGAGGDDLDMKGTSVTDSLLLLTKSDRLSVAAGGIELSAEAIERVVLRLGDGADDVAIGDLSGTAVTEVLIDASFALSTGQGDLATDTITIAGSDRKDAIVVTGVQGGIDVAGLTAQVRVLGADQNDLAVIAAGEGNDTIDAHGVATSGIALVLDGGAGDDRLTGGKGDDRLFGGDGDDLILWTGGSGDDTVEGQDGSDTVRIDIAATPGESQIAAHEGRVAVDMAGGLLDIDGVETLAITAGGGGHLIFIRDLSGTDLTRITVDLAGPDTPEPGRPDAVIVDGTDGADKVVVTGKGGDAKVTGLHTSVTLQHAQDAVLDILGGDGNDVLRASGLHGLNVGLGGGDGDDALFGGFGNDDLSGDDGADRIAGGQGDDRVDLGAGDDVFTYRTGDGDDLITDGGGEDTIVFTATASADEILFGMAGAELRLIDDHSKGPDAFGIEHAVWFGGAGRDSVRVADTSGTGLEDILLDLAAKQGDKHGDGEADLLTLFGTGGSDLIELRGSGDTVTVFGMPAMVTATHLDSDDRIVVEGGEGNDLLLVSTSAPDPGRFTMLGEGGNDVIFGGNGDEELDGGVGDDEIGGGAGQDVMTGGAGADVFSFFGASDSTGRIDIIKDFHHLEGDRIDLSAMDADPATLGDQAFRFIDTAAFDGGHGELRVVYDANGATLSADLDGDRTADFEVRLAGVTAGHALILGDFVL